MKLGPGAEGQTFGVWVNGKHQERILRALRMWGDEQQGWFERKDGSGAWIPTRQIAGAEPTNYLESRAAARRVAEMRAESQQSCGARDSPAEVPGTGNQVPEPDAKD